MSPLLQSPSEWLASQGSASFNIKAGIAAAGLALGALPFLGGVLKLLVFFSVLYLLTGNRVYWILVIWKTLPRDFRVARGMARVILQLWWWDVRSMTVAKILHQLTQKHPDKVAYYTEERNWTYSQLSQLSWRLSRAFQAEGVTRGTPVALMLGGNGGVRIIASWLALAQLGAPAALLPPAARGTVLLHAVRASKAKILVYSEEVVDAIKEVISDPEMQQLTIIEYDLQERGQAALVPGCKSLGPRLKEARAEPLLEELAKGRYKDPLIYIYTSGTTGLPKAAVINNTRFLMIAACLRAMTQLTPEDVLYTPLPLHHTAGGVLGASQALVCGTGVALRNKFSASNFWSDCVKYNCTVAQYIGEICRFLITANTKNGVKQEVPQHRLRFMVGNGLRANLWEDFQRTFRIPHIYEFYGATEGNTNMINLMNQVGAVGFLPRFASSISPILLVKCDSITGEIIRSPSGMCIPCGTCEEGLLLGRLDHKKRLYEFTGYVDKAANDSKKVRDVLQKGDLYFNSGDVLIMDHLGNFYFKDRTGDTFRWRGENVSTSEVESVLSSLLGLADTVVYGVQVPHTEGRAGMAALVDPSGNLDLSNLVSAMSKVLPAYAQPLFLRIIPTVPLTTTFKMIKTDLRKEAFDITKFKDPVYFLDAKTSSYVPLKVELLNAINDGRMRL